MLVLPLLTDLITIVRAPLVTGYGNARSYDWEHAVRTTVRGCVQPSSSSEATGGQDEVATNLRVFLNGDADVTAIDRLEWDGRTWEVNGEPGRWLNPFGGGVHHVELNAVRVVGG